MVNLAEKSIDEILIDHAFCEQKATSSYISLIVTCSYLKHIVDVITPIVRKEWDHFIKLLNELNKRGYNLGKPRQDEYVKGLMLF